MDKATSGASPATQVQPDRPVDAVHVGGVDPGGGQAFEAAGLGGARAERAHVGHARGPVR